MFWIHGVALSDAVNVLRFYYPLQFEDLAGPLGGHHKCYSANGSFYCFGAFVKF